MKQYLGSVILILVLCGCGKTETRQPTIAQMLDERERACKVAIVFAEYWKACYFSLLTNGPVEDRNKLTQEVEEKVSKLLPI